MCRPQEHHGGSGAGKALLCVGAAAMALPAVAAVVHTALVVAAVVAGVAVPVGIALLVWQVRVLTRPAVVPARPVRAAVTTAPRPALPVPVRLAIEAPRPRLSAQTAAGQAMSHAAATGSRT